MQGARAGRTVGLPLAALLAALVTTAGPAPASAAPQQAAATVPAHPTVGDLTTLDGRLAAAERQVSRATHDAQLIADNALRLRSAEIDAERQVALARTGMRQELWRLVEAGPPDPAAAVTLPGASTSGASSAEGAGLLAGVQRRRLDRQRGSLAGARTATTRLLDLRTRAAAAQVAAREQAGQASLAADRARRLLDVADDRAAADATAAAQARDAARVAAARAEQQKLAALQLRLDAADTSLVRAIAPVAMAGGIAPVATGEGTPAVASPDVPDASGQEAVLRLLDSTPAGALPAGYHPTGQVVTGLGSWYGPGFVGSPTSSGTPYDPEQLTCAMLAVPLGTVVRVTTAAGRTVAVLVTDHGPYEPGRVVDLSMRANRAVDLGLGAVRVEVLDRG